MGISLEYYQANKIRGNSFGEEIEKYESKKVGGLYNQVLLMFESSRSGLMLTLASATDLPPQSK